MEKIPKPGEFYRHFKNKMYQVLAVATHSETGEQMVVYQALYGDFGVYVRPLAMFMEPVDKIKYPEAVQDERFLRVSPGGDVLSEDGVFDAGTGTPAGKSAEDSAAAEEVPVNPLLMDFLDADTCEEKMAVLQMMKGKIGSRELDSLYWSLDAKPCEGTIDEQLDKLKQYLGMQQRFDGSRLRRG
ncbi:MAG: DUF1653 domain-containing protein [Clostridium sp.]